MREIYNLFLFESGFCQNSKKPVQTWTRCIVDESKLQQGAEDKCQTYAGPYVNGFRIGDGRQRCINARRLCGHGQQCRNT